MTANLIAVIDIGKTHARVSFLDAHTGGDVWSDRRVNNAILTPLVRELDIREIERWLMETLKKAPYKEHVSTIVPVAHGAAAVFLDENDAVVLAPDYEDPRFESVNGPYEAERDAFDVTFSPRLPLGLNLARQLYFFEQRHPEVFKTVAHILPHAQYWSWRFSRVMASEVTSLGCHTDLWRPGDGRFSALAKRHDWVRLFPPVRFAGELLGTITEEMSARSGLRPDCRVACGIHDSNASFLQHSIDRPRNGSFAVISSGTWTVVMASGTDTSVLRAERDMLANVDAFGATVATARFMGGREYEVIACSNAVPSLEALTSVLERRLMALPSFAGGGPFSAHRGQLIATGPVSDEERATVATLYVALMTELLLENLDARGDVIVDGPLAANPLFARLLAALRPSSGVLPSPGTNNARAICFLAGTDPPPRTLPVATPPLLVSGLDSYRAAWRAALPDVTLTT